jgi:CO/xanthine dehydrogenase FAD-binding subunit
VRGDPASMDVLRPRSAAEAAAEYARRPDAMPLAGGTDLLVGWNAGQLNGRAVLDLAGVREWDRIRADGRGLRIGALVTHARLEEHALVRRRFPLLVAACREVGGVAIQNRGTLAGNVANASPAGDTFPPLAVYDAVVHVVSSGEKRTIRVLDVFAGVKKTTLRQAELIEAVGIPFLKRPPSRQLFRKVGTRAAQALSKVVAACLLWKKKDGRIEEARVALGSVASTVRRLRRMEALVAGERPSAALLDEAAKLVAEEISPIDDVRSTADYRRFVSQAIVRDFLAG